MLRSDSLILAIEPECYRRWLDEARQAATATLLEKAHSDEAAARLQPARKDAGDVAVISLNGYISQKPSMMSLLFGGTSSEWFASMVQAAMADPAIGAVVMAIDSPGGDVFGIPEAAAAIRAARGKKPMTSVAHPLAASAAYYLASQADEVVMTPSALVGSIGVKSVHIDESKALDQAGLNVTEFAYGEHKLDGSSARPLSEEARAAWQARMDYYGKLFESDVAKGRRVSVETVRAKYGQGALFTAKDALAAGLVDRIATMDDVLGSLAQGQRRMGARAEVDPLELRARAALAGLSMEGVE